MICQDFEPEAVAQAEQEAQEQWELEREQLMQQAEEAKLEAQADRVEEVVAMRKGFDDLEAVLKKDQREMRDEAIMKRAHSYSRLSAAVLSLEEALLRGNATKELEALQQAAAEARRLRFGKDTGVELLARPVPTERIHAVRQKESGLRHVLSEHLSRWATAALVPPESGLLGELLGRAFRQLYILDGEDESETARNLRVLGKAAKHTNVREALPLLDELQGLAAKRVEATTREARQVLHVRQTLQAVKAHVQCLNAMWRMNRFKGLRGNMLSQQERLANYAARGEDPSKDQEWLEVFGPPVNRQNASHRNCTSSAMKRASGTEPQLPQLNNCELDPQDFAKRCRIKDDEPRTGSSAEDALRLSLMRYVRCGRYIDRSGIGEEDPIPPHEPAHGSYRSLVRSQL
eukprot:s128_g8.t3